LSGPHQFGVTGVGTVVFNGTTGPIGQIAVGVNGPVATTAGFGPQFANAMGGARVHVETNATVDMMGRSVTLRGLTGTGRVQARG
jgi:hypothetical protein